MSLLHARGGWLALPLLLMLTGCPDEPCSVANLPARPPGILLAGEPAHLPVAPQIPGACEGPMNVHPRSITVEIFDPDQLPVANQATLGTPPSAHANIQFTPDKPGSYHVFAAFEPAGGIHQFDVHAARDRSQEAPLEKLGTACQSLERTSRGAWICNERLFRDGAFLQELPPGRRIVAGDVVWVVDTVQLYRLVDRGGTTLVPTASLHHRMGRAEFLLASPDELVVLFGGTLQRITFDGTGLTVTGSTPWSPGAQEPINPTTPRGILLRVGDRLALVSRPPTGPSAALQSCAYRLEGGSFVRTAESCQQLPGRVIGFEPGVLWLGEPSLSITLSALHRLEWTDAGLVPRGSLSTSAFQPMFFLNHDRPSAVPVLQASRSSPTQVETAVPIHIPGEELLQLEHLDAEIREPLASPSFFWGTALLGSAQVTTRIRVRPSTP